MACLLSVREIVTLGLPLSSFSLKLFMDTTKFASNFVRKMYMMELQF